MSTLEREIIEKFHQLDQDAQRRARELIALETQPPDATTFDYDAWFRDMEALRQEIQIQHGGVLPHMGVVDLLRNIRDGEDE